MCVCGCGYVGCMCVCGPAAGAARLRIEYVVRMRACARGDLVCCSCNSVAENIVRDHASPVTHSRHASAYAVRRTRVRCDAVALLEAGTPSSRLSGCGRGRGGPGPGGWLPEQPAAWKPQTLHTQPQPMLHRNLRQCPHALSVPRRAHVPPAEAHLRPLPPASPIRVPRLAGPCLAHTDLGVAASYAGFLRARLHLLLLCFPCLSVLWCAPVPPAVAHLRHQLAHAMCRGWPKSRPHLPRRRRTLMPHVPLRSTAPPSASPPSHAVCRCARHVPLRSTAPPSASPPSQAVCRCA